MSYIFVTSNKQSLCITHRTQYPSMVQNDITASERSDDSVSGLKLYSIVAFGISQAYIRNDHQMIVEINAAIRHTSAWDAFLSYASSRSIIQNTRSEVISMDEILQDITDPAVSQIVKTCLGYALDHPDDLANYLMVATNIRKNRSLSREYGVAFESKVTSKVSALSSFARMAGNNKISMSDASGNTMHLYPDATGGMFEENTVNPFVVQAERLATHTIGVMSAVDADIRARIKQINKYNADVGEREYRRGLQAGIKMVSDLPEGWSIGDVPGKMEKYYIWKGLVKAQFLNNGGDIYDIPEAARLFFITEIAVPMSDTELDDVLGKGWHPHLMSCGFINSPHDEFQPLCIGDLAGQPITHMTQLPEALKGIYYMSMFDGKPQDAVNILFDGKYIRYDAETDTVNYRGSTISDEQMGLLKPLYIGAPAFMASKDSKGLWRA